MAVKHAFSLIELVVVIGLLSLLMLAISTTMLMTIVSSNRIRTSTKVKQAGNYVVSQLQTLIRNAKSITTCDELNNTITLINPDGYSTMIATELASGETRIASGSGYYLTPAGTQTTNFALLCEPDTVDPRLVKFSFDLTSAQAARQTENPVIHFETSVNLRNE